MCLFTYFAFRTPSEFEGTVGNVTCPLGIITTQTKVNTDWLGQALAGYDVVM